MASEELYGITKQPEDTCPLIDAALSEINGMQKRIRGYERASEEELRDMLSDVERDLGILSGYGRSGLLEDIRRRVSEVRAWGKEWKDLAKEHAPKPEVSSA